MSFLKYRRRPPAWTLFAGLLGDIGDRQMRRQRHDGQGAATFIYIIYEMHQAPLIM
jgi:hypothetical protein